MNEIHLSKKDFRVEWFSGTGAGGQYRNKHQNCCRITHIETGLRATGQSHRDRPGNQREAFNKLARLVLAHLADQPEGRRTTLERIRNYHGVRNEVLDEASRLRMTYSEIVEAGNIGPMIEARRMSLRPSE